MQNTWNFETEHFFSPSFHHWINYNLPLFPQRVFWRRSGGKCRKGRACNTDSNALKLRQNSYINLDYLNSIKHLRVHPLFSRIILNSQSHKITFHLSFFTSSYGPCCYRGALTQVWKGKGSIFVHPWSRQLFVSGETPGSALFPSGWIARVTRTASTSTPSPHSCSKSNCQLLAGHRGPANYQWAGGGGGGGQLSASRQKVVTEPSPTFCGLQWPMSKAIRDPIYFPHASFTSV